MSGIRRFGRRPFAVCCAVALVLLAALAWGLSSGTRRNFATIVIGSKEFPEPIILGEVIKYLALDAGAELVRHEAALGNTDVVWSALVKRQIDIYVEYKATLRFDIMGGLSEEEIEERLAEREIERTDSLGFQNPYGLGMSEALAAHRGIEKISDLAGHRDLVYGLTREFQRRNLDGWEPLKRHYAARDYDFNPDSVPTTVEHRNAYDRLQKDPSIELEAGQIQVTDVYLTDAEIDFHDVRVLEDDLGFFPNYDAILLYRADLDEDVLEALRLLPGKIPVGTMRRMNGVATRLGDEPAVVADGAPREEPFVNEKIRQVAHDFLATTLEIDAHGETRYRWRSVARNTREHLFLVYFSLAAGILVALPLACFTAWNGAWLRRAAFWLWLVPPPAALGAMRAIGEICEWLAGAAVHALLREPSAGLLAWIDSIPERLEFLGRGAVPALLVLFVYAAATLLQHTSKGLKVMARRSDPPIVALLAARPFILYGLRLAAPLITGIAILGTIVDAGGYGGWIRAALDPRFDDPGLGLWGVFPAIALTFLFWYAFGAVLWTFYRDELRHFSRGEMPSGRTAEIDPISSH